MKAIFILVFLMSSLSWAVLQLSQTIEHERPITSMAWTRLDTEPVLYFADGTKYVYCVHPYDQSTLQKKISSSHEITSIATNPDSNPNQVLTWSSQNIPAT